MFAAFRAASTSSPACGRVEALVRQHFGLCADDRIQVSEVAISLPGCPPSETQVVFWTDRDDGSTQAHHCKVFKPARLVQSDDLPPAWMKSALAVAAAWGCECC